MGPQHIAAENFLAVTEVQSDIEQLQWGRSTSLRKTARA